MLCSNLSTFLNDGFNCNVATHDEGMRLLAGLVVLFPVVPFSEKNGNNVTMFPVAEKTETMLKNHSICGAHFFFFNVGPP